MKKLLFLLCVSASLRLIAADKIHIIVPASLTGDTALSRQPLTLAPLSPLPRTYNTNVFSRQAIARYTDTNGV